MGDGVDAGAGGDVFKVADVGVGGQDGFGNDPVFGRVFGWAAEGHPGEVQEPLVDEGAAAIAQEAAPEGGGVLRALLVFVKAATS